MSTKITIEISLAADEQPNAREQAILNSMAAHPAGGTTVVNNAAAAPVAAAPAPAAKAEAAAAEAPVKRGPGRPKAAAAPAPTPKAAEVPMALDTSLDSAEEEEADVEEEAEDDLLGGDEEEGTTYTKEDAIAKATQLVSAQKQAVVKAALVKAGAKRVSDLNDSDAIQVFMTALEG
jgi:hypothetical protein